jgi:enterochelin esterase family protein
MAGRLARLPWRIALAAIWLFAKPTGAGEVRAGLGFRSEALAATLPYSLYLPDAYAAEPTRRFPVIYLLHGYGAGDREWIELGRAAETLDRLIASGEAPPMIAVMPYGTKSWYVDSAALGGPGDYETAIVRDLPEHIESAYRARTDREGRAIAGLSMGGYGALRLAFFHPARYIAAASLSGALYDGVGIPDVGKPVAEAAAEAEQWYFGAYGRPFDPRIYLARSPFSQVAMLGGMERPPSVLIACGDDDYFKFYEGAAAMFTALRNAGLPAELRIEDGGHDWPLWARQFPEVLRFFAKAFEPG